MGADTVSDGDDGRRRLGIRNLGAASRAGVTTVDAAARTPNLGAACFLPTTRSCAALPFPHGGNTAQLALMMGTISKLALS